MDKFKIASNVSSGSHGSIYSCKDDQGKVYAVKRVPEDELLGLKCPLEMIVMNSFEHTNLNSMIGADIRSEDTYIVQHMAECDLHTYIQEYDLSDISTML